MATEFQMPKLGLTMESGTIMEWLVPEGAAVTPGTVVMLIETDKVETEIEISAAGLLHQTGEIGETYDCGVRIGWLLEEGEAPPVGPAPDSAAEAPGAAKVGPPPPTTSQAAPAVAGGRLRASPNARRVAGRMGVDLAAVSGTGPGGRIVSEDVERHAQTPSRPADPPAVPGAARPASIAARQLADLLGIDLAEVPARDGDARISKDDVVLHVRRLLAGVGPSEPPAERPATPLLQEPSQVIPMKGMRGTIASRMHQSLAEMAQLTLAVDVDMRAVVADRDRRRSSGTATPPGYTDYVIAAAARALVEHPRVNSQITDDGLALLPAVHVGMAVALDEGLVVPVVADAADRELEDLAVETSRLAAAARDRKLKLSELEGATFSVTALGMYGVDGFTPIINPPNTAILGVGRIREQVVWVDGAPAPQPTLTLSLTWDHRAFDGAPAAQFVQTVRTQLEAWPG